MQNHKLCFLFKINSDLNMNHHIKNFKYELKQKKNQIQIQTLLLI